MNRRFFGLSLLTGLLAAMLILGVGAAQATPTTIDFETLNGPSVFVSPDPPLTIGIATFSGGQILTNTVGLPADETTVYGTAAMGSFSPTITITFSVPVSNFSTDVLNGMTTIVSYTVADNLGGTVTKELAPNFMSGKAAFSLPDAGITSVTIAQTTTPGFFDFFIDNVSFSASPLLVRGSGFVLQHGVPLGTFNVDVSFDGVTATGRLSFALPVVYQGKHAYLTASSTSPRFAYVKCDAGKPVSATYSGDGSFVLRSLRGSVLLRGTGYIKATVDEGHTGSLFGYVAPTGPPFMPEIWFPTSTFVGHLDISNAYCPT